MCDRIVELVEQQNDIFFNLLSLKHKLLLPARDCAKCHSKKNNWCIISTCHHEVCSDCLDFKKGTKCPVCNIQFDSEKHVSTIEDMRIAYRSMEELIWKVQALDKRTLDSLYADHKEALKDRIEKLNTICAEQTDSEQCNSQHNISEQNSAFDCTRPQSPMDMFEEVCETQLSPVKDNHDQLIDNLSFISNCNDIENSPNEDIHLMNTPPDSINCNDSDEKKSEDDIIAGTPERSFDSSEDIFLSISGITTEEDLDLVKEFVSFFKIRHQSNWCDEITHLVVKNKPNGFVVRTLKYTNALLNNCVIVNIEWIKDSLGSERLKPAVNYMPKDKSGEPAPLISWQVGKGIIYSPLEWCKHCALYFHSHLRHFKFSSSLKIWAEKVGFVVLNEMSEFEDCQLKMRFILYDKSVKESKDPIIIPPDCREMTRWICDYKAVSLDTDWFLECLFQYRFVKIDHVFHLSELSESLLNLTEMDSSNFIFNRSE